MATMRTVKILGASTIVVCALALVGSSRSGAVTSTLASPTQRNAVSLRAHDSSKDVALNVPINGSGGFNYTQGSYLEGFQFTVRHTIYVTKLGAYDSNLSALPDGSEGFASVPVGLYDMSTNKLLASVEVSATDPATGVYLYATLKSPVALNKKQTYAVVWVSLSNYYVASPTLTASDVNPAINYLAMVGNGPGGLTMTEVMVEPNWSYTKKAHGLHAINYDLGPNFIFSITR